MRVLEKAPTFLIAFGGALAGAYLGTRLAIPAPPTTPSRPAAESAGGDVALPSSPSDFGGLLPEGSRFAVTPVRATLDAREHDAIAAAVARVLGGAGTAGAPPAAEPPAPSPEAAQARRDAEQVIERARSAKAWTDDDALAFQQLLVRLTPKDREAVVLALTRALNEGRIALRTDGPPF